MPSARARGTIWSPAASRPDRIRVIHPGVDSKHYRPGPPGRRSATPSFLYVGRLKRYKGIDFAIRALARRAGASVPTCGWRSRGPAITGPSWSGWPPVWSSTASVVFHGFVSEERKIDLMRSAWANMFPSPKEGWGITVIEAAACGTPSLASDSPGLRDSVCHGETGFLVPHGDIDALAARMLELADSPPLVARLGDRARRFAEGLTWERTARETEDHLNEIIKGSATG